MARGGAVILVVALGCVGCAGRGRSPALATPEGDPRTWCRYVPGSLAAMLQRARRESPLPQGMNFAVEQVPTRARVRYAGEIRPISPEVRVFLEFYGRTLLGGSIARLHRREVRFLEDTSSYWLAVQDPLIPDLRREVRPGELVTIFALYFGALVGPETTRRQIVVTEFESSDSTKQWVARLCPSW